MTIADKLQTVAENQQRVYDAGAKSEYDRFWDSYQDYGNRKGILGIFAGSGWTAETFKPKYSFGGTTSTYDNAFYACGVTGDLVEILKDLNIEFITTGLVYGANMFRQSKFTRIGVLDFSKATSLNQCFQESKVVTIDKVIVSETTTMSTSAFAYALNLENITFEGVIAKTVHIIQSTKLSHDSIVNIINTLSTTATGQSLALSKTAVNKAFETATNAKDGSTSTEWATLIATKPNWTISLV